MQEQNSKEKHIYTVSEITKDIKLVLENTFPQVWVEGEISNFKAANSGHFYFSLKDETALLAAAMFARANKDIKFKIEDGLKVICFGRIDVYPARGQYQLIVERIEPKGIGSQQLAFEQLKSRLLKEGLFDAAHKRELPLMPFCAGIVTSSAGAAVRDILQILKKGAPCVDVIIRSVRVQGESAAKEIAQAVDDFNQFKKVDIIIISRGGGSTEDLWSFNEEAVARAIYNSKIPTISAVGHQINITLSDLVADLFVETPSAAAKNIVDKKNALLRDLDNYIYELTSSATGIIQSLKHNLIALRHMLKSPLDRLLEKQQLLDELNSGLLNNMKHYLNITKERTLSLLQRLDTLSPLSILSRGYSLSMVLPEGAIVKDAAMLKKGDKVKTVLDRGAFISSVEEVASDEGKTKF
jgi:exodeoxyribonuclease VII large subunit